MTFLSNRIKFSLLALTLVAALPALAAKHRAVEHPANSDLFRATIKGVVLDSATGAPVIGATVAFGNTSVLTDAQGNFQLLNATASGPSPVTVSRSGYVTSTQTISAAGTFNLTFALVAKPTVTVRQTNGTTLQVDAETVEFGYLPSVFSGYVKSDVDTFCRPDGTDVEIRISDIKRIIGPAVATDQSNCCERPLQKVRLELRNGQSTDAFFRDSCPGYTIDLIARNHATSAIVYLRFSDIAEIIFP